MKESIITALLTIIPLAAQSADFIQTPIRENMDGTVSRALVQQSKNFINMKFPYEGDTHLDLVIVQTANPVFVETTSPSMIKFMADRGQIYCGSVTQCSLSYRLDNGPVRKLQFNAQAEDGSSNSAFIDFPILFAKQLKGKKTLVVEVPFFQEGKQQFTFDLQKLQPAFVSFK
ncbi:hypothetical protein [Chimaeribacter arupi]|uniref:hypothetical protein n=1 Tax=Chimaeribacter arupi TaxID=2060066 RepID=UPI002944B3F2|nr:hypothetical protein [Chimaeribacter arupi]MDV5142133.1 hypothetical protein [Chimaeribacter arupi]